MMKMFDSNNKFNIKVSNRRLKRLTKYISKSNVVVDVGCSWSPNPFIKSKELIGIDIEEKSRKKLTSNYDKFIGRIDLNRNKIPLKDNSVDVVISNECGEHILNTYNYFFEIKRILKPGGKILLGFPNPYYWVDILANLFPNFIKPVQDGHYHFFSRVNINKILKYFNLKLIKVQGTYFKIPILNLRITLPSFFINLSAHTLYIIKKN